MERSLVRRTRLTVIAAAAVAAVFPFANAAFAATPKTTGVVNVWSVSNSTGDSAVQPTMFTGAFSDYGPGTEQDKNGKIDPDGNYIKMGLKKGTFTINITPLNTANIQPMVNAKTCSIVFKDTGPAAVVKGSGTGAYVNISGTFTVTITFASIGSLTKAGKCNMAQNAPAVAAVSTVEGSGTISFG
jgi:hypothetical protein